MYQRLRSFVLFLVMFTASFAQVGQVSANEQNMPPRKVIVVDAGHGGPDSGARGVNNIFEKEITLAVSNQLAALLRESGAIVFQTREDDSDLSTELDKQNRKRHLGDLKGRLGVVRKTQIDAFVSIHCNAGPAPDWRGAHVIYREGNEAGKHLAEITQENFRRNLLPTKRQIDSNRTLYLLKRIEGPAILAEVGFVTNPEEAVKMTTPGYQKQIAFALYTSLLQYFADQDQTNPALVGQSFSFPSSRE